MVAVPVWPKVNSVVAIILRAALESNWSADACLSSKRITEVFVFMSLSFSTAFLCMSFTSIVSSKVSIAFFQLQATPREEKAVLILFVKTKPDWLSTIAQQQSIMPVQPRKFVVPIQIELPIVCPPDVWVGKIPISTWSTGADGCDWITWF